MMPITHKSLRLLASIACRQFTRTASDTIQYRFTVDDPTTFTKAWSAEITMYRIDGPIFEYACHEGNYGLGFVLSAARVQERLRP